MSILEKLKAIGIHIPKLKSLVSIRFGKLIHIDNSVHIHGSTVNIDPDKLNGKQRRALKRIIREDILPEAGAIIEERNEPTIKQVLAALPSKEDISKKLTPVLRSSDIPLLNACLFLRHTAGEGEPVEEMKAQIVRVYGARGRNFSNLCSAGYLETWLCPLYDELLRANPDQPAAAKAEFQIHYNQIVTDLPWTEFVSTYHTARVVTAHIKEKMKRNIANGVRYLNIHGLGKGNVTKIEGILAELQKETGAIIAKVEKTTTRIFVRLEIPPKA